MARLAFATTMGATGERLRPRARVDVRVQTSLSNSRSNTFERKGGFLGRFAATADE